MGKKSKAAKGSDASTKPLTIESLESLLDRILSEYIQVSTVPSGAVKFPVPKSKHETALHMTPLCHWERGCPQNLAQFQGEMDATIACAWWARSRLRYSCSTLTVLFVKVCVPKLKALGMEALPVQFNGEAVSIRLEDLEIMSLGFEPQNVHKIVLEYNDFRGTMTEAVEAIQGYPPHCSHNVLQCKNTGVIVDIALGQFLGTMQTYIFQNQAAFEAKLPGKLLYINPTTEGAIQEQFDRDSAAYRMQASPDCVPERFWKRLVKSIQEDPPYCANCKGVATTTSTPLKRCTGCKKVFYCGRDCQKLHWKYHKVSCFS